LSALGNLANNSASGYGQSQQQYGQYNTNDMNALNNYSSYLTSNPATDQYNAENVANLERGASETATQAQAGLSQSLAQRGISPNSSIGVGGLAQIQDNLAGTDAQVRGQIGQQEINQRSQNLATNANLWNNAANTQFGRQQALGQQTEGLDQNLYNMNIDQALQQYQQAQQQQAANASLWGGVASAVGTFATPWLAGSLYGATAGAKAAGNL